MDRLGNVHHDAAPAADDPPVLPDQRPRITEVLEQSLVEHDVERAIAKRHAQRVRADQVHDQPPLARLASHQFQRRRRVVEDPTHGPGRDQTDRGREMTLRSIWAGSYYTWTNPLSPWPEGMPFDAWWAIAKDDFAAVQATMQRLQANCDACHEAFRIDTTAAAAEE